MKTPTISSLRERDAKLTEAWYVFALSRELGRNSSLSRVVYDRPLIAMRDADGQASVFRAACLHRAADLSEGHMEEGCLRCPYHGWTYDSQGEVVHVPSEGPDSRPKNRMRLPKLPSVERDGCLWVWTGESTPPPEASAPGYRFPETGPGWRSYFMITDFENEVTHLAENFMDVPHTVFVHRGWFRSQALRPVPIRVDTSQGRVLVTYDQSGDVIGFTSKLVNPKGHPMKHTDCFIYPNVTQVDYNFGPTDGFSIISQITPVTTHRCRVYTRIAYRIPFLGGLLKPFFRFYTRRVIEQDVVIMRNQSRSMLANPDAVFHSTTADIVHLAIERLRRIGSEGGRPDEVRHSQSTTIWV